MSSIKVNQQALKLVAKLLADPDKYNVNVVTTPVGSTIIDTGVKAKGGYLAGKVVTEICLGGYGHADIYPQRYGSLRLPAIHVHTDHPAIATLGSQLAGWNLKVGAYQAIASGPARALALKPKKLFSQIGYSDQSDSAVIVLESANLPGEAVAAYIAEACGVSLDKLYILVAPTASVTGLTQISGRIVEMALHKLVKLDFDPRHVLHGFGYAPISPFHPDTLEAMGRANDMLLYGGSVHLTVEYLQNETKLKNLVEQMPSAASKDYGRPFAEIFRSVDCDFYKINPDLFAPGEILITNVASGNCFQAGSINVDLLKTSISRQH
jgi:methenyltetrahydromethanopterin cyclohydrolase